MRRALFSRVVAGGSTATLMMTMVVFVATPAGAAAPAKAKVFDPMPCPQDVLFDPHADVRCGFVTVPENRSTPSGRTITVAAAVVKARSSSPKSDPIVFLDGGPSFGAISSFAMGAYFRGANFVEDRDVILVDTRGTGIAQPRLGCPELDEASVTSSYSKPFVDSRILKIFRDAYAACRDRLTASGIDLSAYNSAESAADLEDLRRALGYKQWNLFAASADGVLGLTYMRLFPSGIRSAVIDSGQSTQFLDGLDYLRGNRELLDKIFAGCAANAACQATYPNIGAVFYDLVSQLEQQPAIVPIPDFVPQGITVRVDGMWFVQEAIGEIFPGNKFEPEHIHDLLSNIWRSAHGELSAVFREIFGTGPFTSDQDGALALGKTMSYVCRDIVGFVTHDDLTQAAHDLPEFAPLLLDPAFSIFLPSPASCKIWNVPVADPVQHQPVSSTIPTLVLAGEYDAGGGVPPFIVRQIPPTLPNSFYYELPASGHLQIAFFNTASGCARSITAQFLTIPSRQPNSTCIASVPQFDFTPPS